MTCPAVSRRRVRSTEPRVGLNVRVVALEACFNIGKTLESQIVSARQRRSRRSLSQTRALQVLKEVAEALNSATTEQRAAGEALRRMADLLGVETARLAEQSIEHARDDERSRIARAVHDTLAQEFTAIGLHIEAGLSHLKPRNQARAPLKMALEAARQGLDEARRSIASLRASPLENRSLAEALAALARRFTADTGVRVLVDIADAGPLADDIESELF